MGKASKRISNLLRIGARSQPLGATPAAVVHRENKWRLLRYDARPEGLTGAGPLLIVPSLINRHYVLDLGRGRSFVEYMVRCGHDVYMIDWGTPGPEDRYLELDHFCDRYIGRAVRRAARISGRDRVHLLGYCLGGTFAAIHAAVRPERIASLGALAAPIDFDDGGMLSTWSRTGEFDVDSLVAGFGNVPWQLMQASFHLMKPTLMLAKLVNLVDRAWDDQFLDGFVATERWGNDNVSFPGACYRTYIDALYRKNALIDGGLTLAGRPVDLAAIDCPTLAVTFSHDHIVPEASAAALIDRVSARQKELVSMRGGHIGAVVSRKASTSLWPRLDEFYQQAATPRAAPDVRLAARPWTTA